MSGSGIMSFATIEQLKSLGQSYLFVIEMRKISRAASGGDQSALATLENMLSECKDPAAWRNNSYWCSAVVQSLAQSATPKSMAIMLQYSRDLPEETPYGIIELIANLLPGYGKAVGPELKKFAAENPGGPLRAIGIQGLCNLYLEGQLDDKQSKELEGLIKDFQPDNFLTQHLVDLSLNRMEGSQKIVVDDAIEELLKDIIVENK